MPSILSGSKLRTGGSGEFIELAGAMPQLPATSGTTGYTLITDSLLQTRYSSNLGNIEFNQATLYSNLESGTIRILATGTNSVSSSTDSGTLVVTGGVGIGRNLRVKEDIVVNNITFGQGFEGFNNLVIRGTATNISYSRVDGQDNIAIGYSVLNGLSSAYASIGIGQGALSSGTGITNSIAIGNNALNQLGVKDSISVASITGITQASPVVVSAPDHNLLNATNITITDVVGMTEITTQTFYVDVLSDSTFSLYQDVILSVPVDGTSFSEYVSSGTVNRLLLKDNNIAIGNNSGKNLIDGRKNFLFGDEIAKNLTTGSYNFFVGVGGQNIKQGNNNISINGSNIVDGIDNQINFGSVFYYNGADVTTFHSNLRAGLGEPSTSSTTGAVIITGGLGVSDDVNIGGVTTSTSPVTGAVTVSGGVGIGENLNVGKRTSSESIQIVNTVFNSTATTVNAVSQYLIDSYSLNNYRSSKYFIQIDEGLASSARFQSMEIMVVATNTGTAKTTEYGLVTSEGELGSFSKDVTDVGGEWIVNLYFTPNDTIPKTIKVLRTAMTV